MGDADRGAAAAELSGLAGPFALLQRSRDAADEVELLDLELRGGASLEDVDGASRALVVVPYREIARRGLDTVDDGTALLVFDVVRSRTVGVDELWAGLSPAAAPTAEAFSLVPDDAMFAARVDDLVQSSIVTGDGANFVVHRELVADLGRPHLLTVLRAFLVLVGRSSGAHWTFLVWTGEEFLVGASPEPHVTLERSVAAMTPISGTLTPAGPRVTEGELLGFLADAKETDELAMVLDEELKMMTRVCDEAPVVLGPTLREMAHVLHTEYRIEGTTRRHPGEVLAATLLAPTIIGSPLSSACRVVVEQAPQGRGYYGGVLALAGPDEHGRPNLDSCILIRTARIDRGGRLRAAVGATVVRQSAGSGEAAETRGKAAALLEAFTTSARPSEEGVENRTSSSSVVEALESRRAGGAAFWRPGSRGVPAVRRGRARIVDAGDDFTRMLAAQLEHLGWACEIVASVEQPSSHDVDLVLLGPGPGDPTSTRDPVIVGARRWVEHVLATRTPAVAVCLSHQLVGAVLGCGLARLAAPRQGRQLPVDVLGMRVLAGFYNSFGVVPGPGLAGDVRVEVDTEGVVVALLAPTVTTLQFHPESYLTSEGPELLRRAVQRVVGHDVQRRRTVRGVSPEGERSA